MAPVTNSSASSLCARLGTGLESGGWLSTTSISACPLPALGPRGCPICLGVAEVEACLQPAHPRAVSKAQCCPRLLPSPKGSSSDAQQPVQGSQPQHFLCKTTSHAQAWLWASCPECSVPWPPRSLHHPAAPWWLFRKCASFPRRRDLRSLAWCDGPGLCPGRTWDWLSQGVFGTRLGEAALDSRRGSSSRSAVWVPQTHLASVFWAALGGLALGLGTLPLQGHM